MDEQFLNVSLKATLANTLPLTLNVLDRETNSIYFKSYRSIRVNVDVQKFRQLRAQKSLAYFSNYAYSLQDSGTQVALNGLKSKINDFKNWSENPQVISKLIKSKEVVLRSVSEDFLVDSAKNFIRLYDSSALLANKYAKLADSLQQVYNANKARINQIKRLSGGQSISSAEAGQLIGAYGHDDAHTKQLQRSYDGFQTLSAGRTIADYSTLTLYNINVTGVNVEYARNKILLDAIAGSVDFFPRDFLNKAENIPKQYVYAARMGYGNKNGNNVMLTFFGGKKQLYGGSFQNAASLIQGLSLSARKDLSAHTSIYGEIAQSSAPYIDNNFFTIKSGFHIHDKTERAYHISINSFWPLLKTKADGFFEYTGLNFQAFNGFQYNSTTNKWYGEVEKEVWSKMLTIKLSESKNDFNNSTVLQRYAANTIFKNATLFFHKKNWPTIYVGYLPSSQYTVVDSQVYENHYQIFTTTSSYKYRVGLVTMISSTAYSRFYNGKIDSSLLYNDSKNFYWNQMLVCAKFNAAINLSVSQNSKYKLYGVEENISAVFFKRLTISGAIKIYNLNDSVTKIGVNLNARLFLKNFGTITARTERDYLPSNTDQLYLYKIFNIGFIKYFN